MVDDVRQRVSDHIAAKALARAGAGAVLTAIAPWPSRLRAAASRWATPAVGLVLAICYALSLLHDPARPGIRPDLPLGWWAWHDQAATLRSTAAFAHATLDASQHYYPPGYALLGVLPYLLAPDRPFLVVDLLSLLVAFAGFVGVARRLGVPGPAGALLFLAATVSDGLLFRQWVIPWNTTPVAALVWALLAACLAWLDGRRRPVLVGALAGGIAACRPSDAVLALPCLLALAWADRSQPRRLARDLARAALGAAIPLAPVVALHLAIYGPAPSDYMRVSRQIGFTLHDLGWKAYVVLVDPYAWFADGRGMLQRAHWLALGLAGLAPALARGAKDRVVAAVLAANGLLYVAYVDLLPTGLWRFMNVHYVAWTLPGYALLACLLLRDLARPGAARRVAAASLAATLLPLCLRVEPTRAAADAPAKAVDFAGPLPPFTATYFGPIAVRDARGTLWNNADMRALVYPGGVRVIGLRRDLAGPVAFLPGHAPPGFEGVPASSRWAESLRFAWPPAWLGPGQPPAVPIPEQ